MTLAVLYDYNTRKWHFCLIEEANLRQIATIYRTMVSDVSSIEIITPFCSLQQPIKFSRYSVGFVNTMFRVTTEHVGSSLGWSAKITNSLSDETFNRGPV